MYVTNYIATHVTYIRFLNLQFFVAFLSNRIEMKANIARVLQIPVECIGVKASTSEKLGFTGRGEGIASEAVATVSKMV